MPCFESPRCALILPKLMVGVVMTVFALSWTSCGDGALGSSQTPTDYQDPLHPQYMATPTVVMFPDTARIFLENDEYQEFQQDLQGFMESNNESQFERHFRDYYIPETFTNDSIFDLYVTMWNRWDSIGVRTRLDHWTLLYASPFFAGDIYDVGLAEIDLRHHMVFEKRWTGNYKNFGRTLGERYPGATISYVDTTYVDAAGDTIFKRHITAQTRRLLYAVRSHSVDSIRTAGTKWLNDGWQAVPDVVAVMDSAAVAQAEAHRNAHGILPAKPIVSGR
jgi:hypothetical protein